MLMEVINGDINRQPTATGRISKGQSAARKWNGRDKKLILHFTDSSDGFCKIAGIITFVKFSSSHFESRGQTTWLRTNEVFANLAK